MDPARGPFVSVVTPVYNTADYLSECIESVLQQTHENFEYLLVDNCSTDRSLAIAHGYARYDPRVRVVRGDRFRGQTDNHNFALAHISPDSVYTKVLQSDDWLYPQCLEQMVRVAERGPRIGIVGAYTLLGDVVYLDGLPVANEHFSGREVIRRFLLDGLYVTGSPTSTLIRSDLVRARQPFYDPQSAVFDVELCLDLLRQCDFGFVHQVLSYTRRDNESIISRLRNYRLMEIAQVLAVRKHGPTILKPAEYRRRRAQVEARYERFLGESVLRGYPADFWRYHRWALAPTDIGLTRMMVVRGVARALADVLLNPKTTAERTVRKLRRSWPRRMDTSHEKPAG